MIELHNWLHDELAVANRPSLQNANTLVVQRNAILSGLDTEAATRLTETITAFRNSPTPIKTDDLPAILRGEKPVPGPETDT